MTRSVTVTAMHNVVVMLAGVVLIFLSPAASADLLATVLQRAIARAAPVDNDSAYAVPDTGPLNTTPSLSSSPPTKQKPHFQFADVDYRVSKRGLKASFAYGSVSAQALVSPS